MQIETSIHIRYTGQTKPAKYVVFVNVNFKHDRLWFTSVILNCAHNYNLKQLPLSTVKPHSHCAQHCTAPRCAALL